MEVFVVTCEGRIIRIFNTAEGARDYVGKWIASYGPNSLMQPKPLYVERYTVYDSIAFSTDRL
jgi:hypothetical protein